MLPAGCYWGWKHTRGIGLHCCRQLGMYYSFPPEPYTDRHPLSVQRTHVAWLSFLGRFTRDRCHTARADSFVGFARRLLHVQSLVGSRTGCFHPQACRTDVSLIASQTGRGRSGGGLARLTDFCSDRHMAHLGTARLCTLRARCAPTVCPEKRTLETDALLCASVEGLLRPAPQFADIYLLFSSGCACGKLSRGAGSR